jgi:uncharacterized protein (TIGR02001 family)
MRARRSSGRREAATAHAQARACRARGSRTRLILLTAAGIAACRTIPAHAETGATVSIFNDLRFRGYSLSDGRPVAIFDFAYDDPSGFYADGAATGVLRRGGNPAPLGLQLSGGYARRLASGTTLDFGITHSAYSRYSTGTRGNSYTEIYAGIARGALSSRIFLSPHYFERGLWTAYGEIDGSVSPAPKWSLDGHVGMLVALRRPSPGQYARNFDWRVGVSRELGRLSLHAAWSDGAPAHRDRRGHIRSAVVVGASWVL